MRAPLYLIVPTLAVTAAAALGIGYWYEARAAGDVATYQVLPSRSAPAPLPPVALAAAAPRPAVPWQDHTVRFQPASVATLDEPGDAAAYRRIVDHLKADPTAKIRVTAYFADATYDETNKLPEQRHVAVRQRLTAAGVATEAMTGGLWNIRGKSLLGPLPPELVAKAETVDITLVR